MAQIKNNIFRTLLFQFGEFALGFFHAVASQAGDVQIAHFIGQHFADDGGIGDVGASERNFFRFGILQTQDS